MIVLYGSDVSFRPDTSYVTLLSSCLETSLSFFFFLSLCLHGRSELNDRFSFYFVNSLKEEESAPPNAIIQSTPPQRYTCFPLSKTDNFSS